MVRIEGEGHSYPEPLKGPQHSQHVNWKHPHGPPSKNAFHPPSDAPMHFHAYEQDLGQEFQKIANLLHELHEHPESAKEIFFQSELVQAISFYKGIMSVIDSSTSGLSSEERKKLDSMASEFEKSVLNQPIKGGLPLMEYDTIDVSKWAQTLQALVQQPNLLSQMEKNSSIFASKLLSDAASVNIPTSEGKAAAEKVASAIANLKKLLAEVKLDDKDGKRQLAKAVLDLRDAVFSAQEVSGREGLFLANMWNVIGEQVIYASIPDGSVSLFFAAQDAMEGNFSTLNRVLETFKSNPNTFNNIILGDLTKAEEQFKHYGS